MIKSLKKHSLHFFILVVLLISDFSVWAQPRFPEPEFETGHVPPPTQIIEPRSLFFEYLDVFVLFALLALNTWLIFKKRSRTGIILSAVFSVLYFGFWREGCVCSVGSLQNVVLALFDKDYVIPLTVIAFFMLPLLFTLFFGRVFCSGVCFFGAIQDLLIFKPVKIPEWWQKAFGILPYIYLALTLLLAATGAEFITCKYDPFVGFFRFDGKFYMILIGIVLLLLSIFIARPYCRFLCPYGVLLNWISRISFHHLTITPKNCVDCNLCETSCPVDAIHKPNPKIKPEPGNKGPRRLFLYFVLLPLWIGLFGFCASLFYKPLSFMHVTIRLADEISDEIKTGVKSNTQEAIAFNGSGIPVETLLKDAAIIQNQFYTGTWILGGFLGFIFGISLIRSSVLRKRINYEPNKASCINCARCLTYCPVR